MILGKTITQLTKSATDYITIEALKRHLRIEDSNKDHDSYLLDMLPACFDLVDSMLGYCSRKSTVEYLFDETEKLSRGYNTSMLTVGSCLHIPARIVSITSVKYLDADGVEGTLSANTDYQELNSFSASYGFDLEIINAPGSLYDYGWRYKVTAVEGFEPNDAYPTNKANVMPDAVIHAIKLLAGQYWSERMGIIIGTIQTNMDFSVENLLSRYAIKEFI